MADSILRGLRIFLCHSSGDKPAVREFYGRLSSDGMEPWFDEEDLLPGQDWAFEIHRAVSASDVVIVCLSRRSITKAGYVQKEIKVALDIADEQPEDAIFLIPVKLEECDVPARLRRWHWVNLYEELGYQRLMRSLRVRSSQRGFRSPDPLSIDESSVDLEVDMNRVPHRVEHRRTHKADHRLLGS